MKTFWIKWKQKNWESRAARERQIILIGIALITPLVVYFLLWQPAQQAVGRLSSTLPELRIQAESMRGAARDVEEMRHRPQLAIMNAAAVKAAIEESADRHQLRAAINTLDMQEPNAVRISFSAVSFAQWLTWSRELQQEQHIRVASTAITPLAEDGMVAIRATLINGQDL